VIKLRVQWPNARNALLATPSLELKADGATLTAVAEAQGRHDFEIPDGTGKLELLAVFEANLPPKG
jgi:hypothetical protein